MPTGYTAKLHEGKPQTFREFGLGCAGAFGACLHMRDDENRTGEIRLRTVSEYAINSVRDAVAELARLQSLTHEQHAEEQQAASDAAIKSWKDSARKSAEVRLRYEAMREQVAAWTPPTKDHEEYKAFMLTQIEESIRFDCGESTYLSKQAEKAEFPLVVWIAERLSRAKSALDRANENLADEEKRVADSNKWITDLIESLPAE